MFGFLFSKRKINRNREKAKEDKTSLGNLLLKSGIIEPDDLCDALEFQDENTDFMLGEALIQLGKIDRGIVEALLWTQRVERGEEEPAKVIQFATKHTQRIMIIKDEVNVMALSLNGKKAKA
ncbi:MAG: hypothetical protein ACTSW7_01180 [Candidatus Thorarchaeota archaeon]|nr:hypothetical protein [Thermoplasmatales archaeon]